MKKEIEQLLLFLIPAVFAEHIFNSLGSSAVSNLIYDLKISYPGIFPNGTPDELLPWALWVDNFLGFIPTAVIATWLWLIEKNIRGRPYLWAFSGLVLSYWVLLLFIGQRLYEQNKSEA